MSCPPDQIGNQTLDHNATVQQLPTPTYSSSGSFVLPSRNIPTTAAPAESISETNPTDAPKSSASTPLDLLSHVALELPRLNSHTPTNMPTTLITKTSPQPLLCRLPPPSQLASVADQSCTLPQLLAPPSSQLPYSNSPVVLPRLPPLSMLEPVQRLGLTGVKRSFDQFNLTDHSAKFTIPAITTDFQVDKYLNNGNQIEGDANRIGNGAGILDESRHHESDIENSKLSQIGTALVFGENNSERHCNNNNKVPRHEHFHEQDFVKSDPIPCSPLSAKRITFLHPPHISSFPPRAPPACISSLSDHRISVAGCASSGCTTMAPHQNLTLDNGAACAAPMAISNLSPVSSHDHSQSPSRSTMGRPNKTMRCTSVGSGHKSPNRCYSPITPISSAPAQYMTVSAPVIKSRSQPSRFCHICSRTSKKVGLVACANFSSGACRKVVCQKCFNE